jgi:hypothetical protein
MMHVEITMSALAPRSVFAAFHRASAAEIYAALRQQLSGTHVLRLPSVPASRSVSDTTMFVRPFDNGCQRMHVLFQPSELASRNILFGTAA